MGASTHDAAIRAMILVDLVALAASQCYYPSGAESPDIPCHPSAEVSMCCGSRSACLSSGLCRLGNTDEDSGISYARGTCTDPTWQSPFCPQRCRKNQDTDTVSTAYDFANGGVQVWQCVGEGYAEPGAYCCESAMEKLRCCQTPTAVFSLPGATIGNALAVQTYSPPSTTSRTASTRTSLPGSSGIGETGSTSTGPATVAESWSLISSSSVGAGATQSNEPVQGQGTAGSSSSDLSDGAKLGLGVGMGVGGVALLLAVGIVFWMWRKTRAQRAAPASGAEPRVASMQMEPGPVLGGWIYGSPGIGHYKQELDGNVVHELGSPHRVHEAPVELHAGYPSR